MVRTKRRGARSSARGFTLLEILLVLAIMALAAALTLPALVRPSGSELRAATATLAGGLRRAREAAVNSNREATLTLDLDRHTFTVSGEPRGRGLPPELELALFTARSELDGERTGRIRFFPDGSSTGGRVSLTSGQRRYHVDVDWLTGQVRVRAGEPGDDGVAPGTRVELRS